MEICSSKADAFSHSLLQFTSLSPARLFYFIITFNAPHSQNLHSKFLARWCLRTVHAVVAIAAVIPIDETQIQIATLILEHLKRFKSGCVLQSQYFFSLARMAAAAAAVVSVCNFKHTVCVCA